MVRSVLLFLSLTAALNLFPLKIQAQCDIQLEYRVETSKISVKSAETLSGSTILLFDMRSQKVVFTKENINLEKDEWTLLFDETPASTYVLVVRFNDCEKIVGGLGIDIHPINE